MFATLLGGLPRPGIEGDDDIDALVVAAIRAQEDAGLEPITDGRLRDPDFEGLAAGLGDSEAQAESVRPVEWWRFAASHTDRAVKQALPGPYTLGRRLGRDPSSGQHGAGEQAEQPSGARERQTLALAASLRREIEALAAAGCPLVEVEELDAHLVGEDEAERALFRESHRRLTEGVGEIHLSLSIVGGSADTAGISTILATGYASLAVDLIKGPDNWRLVAQTPTDRGVIAGVLSADSSREVPSELMLWAAQYAASTGARGIDRVGLGSAGSYANLAWDAAVQKMRRLGEAARLASMSRGEELARLLDPRAVSSRRAALGHDAARPAAKQRLRP